MADRTYTDTGNRDEDARTGFGDDMGTRIGRPDGAGERQQEHQASGGAQGAPHDANPKQSPGQPSTNDSAVPDGIEGSLTEGEGQRDVRNATNPGHGGNPDVNPDREGGKDRKSYDL